MLATSGENTTMVSQGKNSTRFLHVRVVPQAHISVSSRQNITDMPQNITETSQFSEAWYTNFYNVNSVSKLMFSDQNAHKHYKYVG